ncbi:MAG: hypothetical protein ABI237_00005 [Ginsengibacter sp.]
MMHASAIVRAEISLLSDSSNNDPDSYQDLIINPAIGLATVRAEGILTLLKPHVYKKVFQSTTFNS